MDSPFVQAPLADYFAARHSPTHHNLSNSTANRVPVSGQTAAHPVVDDDSAPPEWRTSALTIFTRREANLQFFGAYVAHMLTPTCERCARRSVPASVDTPVIS